MNRQTSNRVEERRFAAAEADGWYLQAPKGVGRRRRSGFGAPRSYPSCGSCYRPISAKSGAYCPACEESGAADRHRQRAAGGIRP